MSVICPGYTIPSRQVFADNKIPALYFEVKRRIKHELNSAQFLSLTFDCWTSNAQQPYIGITAHTINSDWALQTYRMAGTILDVDHTATNLKDIIESTLKDWNIPISKVSAATTDNGTNVIKAVQLMGLNHISCFGHTLNNGVTSSMNLNPVKTIISNISKIRYTFHFSSNLRRLLQDAQIKLDLPQKVMPASCVTRWWTNLPLKSRKIKCLPNCNEQKLILVMCKIFEPLKILGGHMGTEKIVTASSVWPVYTKLGKTLLHTNSSNFTCALTQEKSSRAKNSENFEDSEQLFPILSQCTLMDNNTDSYFNTNEVCGDISDDDVDTHVDSVNTIDNLLDHIENHLKDDINRPFHKRYINKEESRMFLQKICFLDPRYKSAYIDPRDIDTVKISIQLEMDEIGNQAKIKEIKQHFWETDCPVMNNVTDEALNQIELEKYVSLPFISLDADPLQWWKLYHSQLPTVSLLAMKYLCIP
ncbi:zinc finger BED domain-containing protein 4-like, partial [Aphis craccivora]